MSDDSLLASEFDDVGASSDFEPAPKAKAKPAPKKAAAPKAKAAPKKPVQKTLKTTKPAAKRKKAVSDDENSDVEMRDMDNDSLHDDSLLDDTPPNAKRQKKEAAPKKPSGKPLQEIDNEGVGLDGSDDVPPPKPATNKSATDRYQEMTPVEHIIKRPDTYIGSVERIEKSMWVFNSTTESMEMREVSYVPGLYKIFDEIIVNAADNKQNDPNMKEIRVTVDRESGEISVKNDGKGIPIEIHEKKKIYIPEMIFGHLLTSSNYDDDEQKVTGGRNGYGAKLTNIFSTQFTIETADKNAGKKYKQTWTENMGKKGAPKITSHKGEDYTKVTFTPDFKKFKMEAMDDDFEAMVKRRVYDLAGTCSGLKVYLNGDRIKVNSFKKYMEMYTKALKAEAVMSGKAEGGDAPQVIITERPNERWEIGFAVSDGSFQQVSFVNSIATTSGGTHVNYVADQIVTKLAEIVKKKNKGGVTLKPNQIRNHIFLFVNCLIVNPAFTSQTKEQLTTKASQFGSKCSVSEKFLKDIAKTEAVNNIIHFAQAKADQVLKKSDGGRRQRMNNSKLTDANKAGTKDGYKCTLILTEGDSASLLALAGRAVVNPDLFGVFPLRGKLLNVRDASIDQISKNQEIQNIKKFIGLQHKKEYTDTKGLRYGHIMIMTDQDHDGSHIKGLLINFLQVQFPSLLKIDGFLMEFITPIVKVWKGDIKNPKKQHSFFTMPEYEEWKLQPGNQKGWEHKYFKGLGTSSPSDAEIYFRDLDKHLKEFHTMKDNEADLFELAFSKKKADARKEWLREFQPGTFLDLSVPKISYDDFVNKELILFSMADNMRSIPSLVDGFKPGQRKIMYTCFKRNLKKDVKVVDLAGSVSGMTDYAYGDASMQQTIVGLAQNFVGSNNINCLEPSGNFGSRLQGGNDAASARYIYTRLSPFARKIFHNADDALLKYNESDGKQIEPEWFVPILPMILVNGTDGIGTGWSSSIPNYKPEDIVDNLKRRMAGSKEDMVRMTPWFRGFTGHVEDMGGERFKFSGIINQTGDNEVEITELPVRLWTQDFKDRLEEIIKAEKVPSFIKDYTEYNTPERVHFIIKLDDKHMKVALEKGLEEAFKLSKTLATSNLVAFDSQGRIHKYATELDIMEEFYQVRLQYYEKRKQYLLSELQKDLDKLSNQSRFIKMIIDGSLVVSKKKKAVLVEELRRLKFKPFPKVADAKKAGEVVEAMQDEEDEEGDEEGGANDFDYLLGMAIWSLTQERVDKLLGQIADKEVEIDELIKLSPKDLWNRDLDAFLEEWHAALDDEAKTKKKNARLGRRTSQKLGIGAKPGKGKKRKGGDSEDGSDSDFEIVKPKKATKSSTLLSYLNKPAPKPSASANLISTFSKDSTPAEPAVSKEDDGDVLMVDGSSDTKPEPIKAAAAPEKKRGRPAGSTNKTKKEKEKPAAPSVSPPDDDYDEDDVFAAVAKEDKKEESSAPARKSRAVTKKPARYVLSDGSDEEDGDSLLDVSHMVKGIGNNSESLVSNRPLFSESAARLTQAKNIGRPALRVNVDSEDDIDQTDFTKLIPQASPQRKVPRTASDNILSDDEDDEILVKPKAGKVSVKPSSKAISKSVKPKPAAESAKPLKVSPSAKAYALKQQKLKANGKVLPKKAAKADTESEDEDEEDANAIANDLLSDEDESLVVTKPKPKPAPAATTRGRPGRAAAAKPAKYVISDDDSEEQESEEEPSFDEDESE